MKYNVLPILSQTVQDLTLFSAFLSEQSKDGWDLQVLYWDHIVAEFRGVFIARARAND